MIMAHCSKSRKKPKQVIYLKEKDMKYRCESFNLSVFFPLVFLFFCLNIKYSILLRATYTIYQRIGKVFDGLVDEPLCCRLIACFFGQEKNISASMAPIKFF